jgi:hypothetical protein
VSDELGIIGLRGPDAFTLETFSERQRQYKTLLVERLCYPLIAESRTFRKGETILDTAVLLIANSTAAETEALARDLDLQCPADTPAEVELLSFRLDAGRHALVAINFSGKEGEILLDPPGQFAHMESATPGKAVNATRSVELAPLESAVYLCR